MKTRTLLLTLLLSVTSFVSAQSSPKLFIIDKYHIPIGKKGAKIGRAIAPDNEKISIQKDTSKLFTIDKEGYISLKKNKQLVSGSPFRYEIILKYGKQTKAFELVKDEFFRNKVVAHRGAWKHYDVSQNSLGSLKYAVDLKCEGSELDVWLSADNKVVLSHDATIGGKEVEKTTAGELCSIPLKGGEFVPKLEQYLEFIKTQNGTRLVLEMKSDETNDRVLALTDSVIQIIHRHKAQAWVDYISFDYRSMLRVRELDPAAVILYLAGNKTLDELVKDKITGIDYHFSKFFNDKQLNKEAKALGLLTNVWTVNKEDDMKTLLDMGVDYITTDEPEMLLKLVE